MAVITGDSLTYQYDPEGRINTASHSGIKVPFGEDAPERYRRALEEYHHSRPDAWARMVELTREALNAHPDNNLVLEQAWLCGLHSTGGPRVDDLRRQAQREAEECERRREERENRERERADRLSRGDRIDVSPVESWLSGESDGDLEFYDYGCRITVTHKNGCAYTFSARNIFDFGLVINPPLGGLAQERNGKLGWERLRGGWVPMSEDEEEAYFAALESIPAQLYGMRM